MNNLKDISYESEVRAQDDFNFIKQLHDKKLIENSAFEEVHALLNNTMQFKAAEKEKTTLEKEFHDKNQEKAKKEAELLDANNKKMALENLKSAYVRLYATFDDFRTQASTKPAADLEYFALTANNHNGTYIQSGTNAKSVTRLKGIYDEIHTLQGGITRVGNAKKNFPMNPYAYQYSNGYWNELEPHVTQNAVYGNATEKEFQKNVYATVFEYVDKIESTVQAQPGSGGNPGSNTENEKLILKLNLKHDLILKNNDFLKTFINKDGGREDLHMHILYTDMANRFNLNVNYSFDGSSIVGSMGAYDAYINPGCYYIHDNGYTYYNNHYYDGYGILQNNPYQWYYFQIYQNYLTPTIDSLKNALK